MQIRRERRVALPLLGALGLVIGLLIAAALAAPRIKSVSPQHQGGQIPASASISIAFSQRMNPDSVLEHLSVDPSSDFTVSWDDKTIFFDHNDPWTPGSTITVTLSSGARSFGLLPLLSSRTWSFAVGEPRVAYLYPAGQPAEIFTQSLSDDQATPLTETPLGIYDFSLNLQGTLIAYSAERADGGTDLHVLDLVTDDDLLAYSSPEGGRCEAATISPGGDYLAFECFEFQSSVGGQLIPGPRRIWILSLAHDEEPRLAGQEGHITSAPRWSPSETLSFYDSTLIAIAIVDPTLEPGLDEQEIYPSAMGNLSSWSPDGTAMVFAEMVFPLPHSVSDEPSVEIDLDFYTHLFVADVTSDVLRDLSGDEQEPVEDASPSFSPDGQRIAFARRYMDQERFTLGRQIWLKDPDGSNARVLTSDAMINHSALAWSPDSSTLAYIRFDRSNISLPAEIWIIGADGENPHMLVRGGYLPVWIP